MREELTASLVLSHAARWHPDQVVVDGDTLRETSWADLARRAFVFGLALRRRLLPTMDGDDDAASPAPAPGLASSSGGAKGARGAGAGGHEGTAAAQAAVGEAAAAAAEAAAPPPPAPPPPAVVATLAHNSTRHLEAWYAVSAAAAGVVHTLNPRLSPADLRHIVSHAGCSVICAEAAALPLLRALGPWGEHCPRVRHVVFLCDAAAMPGAREIGAALGAGVQAHCQETLIEEEVARLAAAGPDGGGGGGEDTASLLALLQPPYPWPHVSEDAPAGLAYTSGTTGAPKGVLFSHRANFLTALAASLPDALCLGARSTVLMAVPLYHANGWQLPHAAPMTGARLVMPHPSQLGGDGAKLLDLILRTGADTIACVPTVYQGLVSAARLRASQAAARGDLATAARPLGPLRSAVVGGAACPRALAEALELEFGVAVKSLWGMTELAPIGTVAGAPRAAVEAMRREDGGKGAKNEGAERAGACAEAAASARPPPVSSLPPTALTPTVDEIAAGASDRPAERAAVAEGLLRLATGQGRPHCLVDMRIVRRRRPRKRARAAVAQQDAGGRGDADADADTGDVDGEQDDLEELPHDGVAVGHLQVRGGTVMRRYHGGGGGGGDVGGGSAGGGGGGGGVSGGAGARQSDTVVETVRASPALHLARGLPGYPRAISREWFDTGDVASVDACAGGAVRLTDRAKDVIKSGGEWISSIALEGAASRHARVASAAAVGVPHPKWGERPLLVVVRRPLGPAAAGAAPPGVSGGQEAGGGEQTGGGGRGAGEAEEEEEDLAALGRSILETVAADPRLARWQVPDDVAFVGALPLNATGKVSKMELRRAWRGHYGAG